MADIMMSAKAQKVMERYKQGYVTDTQLSKYLQLSVITKDEYTAIFSTKHFIENMKSHESTTKPGGAML